MSRPRSPLVRFRFLIPLCLLCLPLLPGCGEKEPTQSAGKKKPLLCLVGGTMRPAMEALAKLYEEQTGQPVELSYGDSGALIAQIKEAHRADLYVCHDPFAAAADRQGLADRVWAVASVTPTIAVPKGNPKNIRSLRDLARPGLRLGLTDETYSTLGHINPLIFQKAGLRAKIEANVKTRSRMGGEVANAVAIGNLDATIVWNAVVFLRSDKLDAVPIEPALLPQAGVDAVTTATFGVVDMGCVKVTIATLKCSKQPEAAAAFAEFANSPSGQAAFAERGFSPAPAASAEPAAPEEPAAPKAPAAKAGPLLLYCGAGIQPPVAEAIEAFTKETGVAVQADYAGSGILLSKIKASKRGDLYLPGESEYVDRADKLGLVASRRDICYFVPVILVRKGNPMRIKTLRDLTTPGLKLGLGNPEACAVGQASMKIFQKNSLPLDAIKKNTAFESLTVNELGIQLKTGKLDAAIVWDAIAAYYQGSAEAVRIPRAQNVVSRVTISVLHSSAAPEAAKRFVDFLAGDTGQAIFKKHHYTTALEAE